MLTWKPKCGKNHGSPQTAVNHYERRKQQWVSAEATTSCTPSSPHDGYNGGNDLSLCHYTQLRAIHIYQQPIMFNNINYFALSHIYTHMTFGLFTHMAPRGSLRTHSRMCPFQTRSGRSPPVLR